MRKQTLLLAALAISLFTTTVYVYTWEGLDFHGFFDQGYLVTDGNNYLTNTKDGSFHFTDASFTPHFASNIPFKAST